MARNTAKFLLLIFLALSCGHLHALDELFEIYNAPQALAMGNAWTADATGVGALFHNPAGLAKATLKAWEITPVAIDGSFSTGFAGSAVTGRSLSRGKIFDTLQTTPNSYNYLRGNGMASIARRNFAFAILGASELAGRSDGTNADVRAGEDVGFFLGGSTNLSANMLKIGVTGKMLLRNQLLGTFTHAQIADGASTSALMQSGLGIGADVGMLITLPVSYLLTLGFVWKDALGTKFLPSSLLNAQATGVPATIPQSFNVALSVHPALAKNVRGSFSAEFRHIERTDLPLTKRLHFGFQFIARKSLFCWLGLNQMYPTGGVGLRMRGGDFELGTYAQDVALPLMLEADRRFFFRYTIGF